MNWEGLLTQLIKPFLSNPRHWKRLILNAKNKEKSTKEWVLETLKYRGGEYNKGIMEEMERWDCPKFPVSGKDLLEAK